MKFKKELIFLAICTSLGYCDLLQGQQQPNFLFYLQNMSAINPAYTGTQGQFIGLNYRSAWQGIDDAPRSAVLAYNTAERNKTAWGFSYFTDRVYVENQGSFAFDYSYNVGLSAETNLHLGLKGGILYNNINLDKLNRITNEANPALDGFNNYAQPMVGIGALLNYKQFFFAASVPNLLNTERFKELNGFAAMATDRPHYYFVTGFNLPITSNLEVIPNLLYRVVGAAPNLLTAIIQATYLKKYTIGLGLSNNDYISGLVMLQTNNNFSFGYGYEMAGSQNDLALRANTHEIIVKYNFGKRKVEDNLNESL